MGQGRLRKEKGAWSDRSENPEKKNRILQEVMDARENFPEHVDFSSEHHRKTKWGQMITSNSGEVGWSVHSMRNGDGFATQFGSHWRKAAGAGRAEDLSLKPN